MIWIQKHNKFVLRDYPFFNAKILELGRDKKYYQGGYMFNESRPEFDNLSNAQLWVADLLYQSFKESVQYLEHVFTLSDFVNIPYINIAYTKNCNNNGDGRYYKNELWKRYHWLVGSFSITSSISKRYALRYDIDIPVRQVELHGLIIIKRHVHRFIAEYENMC